MSNKVERSLGAAMDALGYLTRPAESTTMDFIYVDRLLSMIVEPPTDGKYKNSRRGLATIRQWMVEDGPGVALLEILGQLQWRVVDMSGEQVKILREALNAQPVYLSMIHDPRSGQVVLERIEQVRQHKNRACLDFVECLGGPSVSILDSLPPIPEPTPSVLSTSASSNSSHSSHQSYSSTSTASTDITSNTGSEALVWDESLSYDGVIKLRPATINYRGLWTNELERDLLDFYINIFAPGQTLAADNNIYIDFLSIAERSEATRYSIFGVAASYLRDYALSDTMKYDYITHNYIALAAQSLQKDLNEGQYPENCLAAGMLLIHHAVVNDNDSEICWSWHLSMIDCFQRVGNLDPTSESALFMTYQHALAMTTQIATNVGVQGTENFSWMLECDFRESQRICGTIGMSRRMLSIIARINQLATIPATGEERLLSVEAMEDEILGLDEWSDALPGDAHDVLVRTAKTYQLAARIYMLCRLLDTTPLHSRVVNLHTKLYELVMSLPIDGPYYTSVYPLWSCFIAAVASPQPEKTEKLYERLNSIRKRNKGNIGPVLACISTLHAWLVSHPFTSTRQKGWWCEMLQAHPPRSKLLSLG